MIDDNQTAQAGVSPPPKGGFFSRAEVDCERVLTAIEGWYALHFHKATLNGVAPISAEDKASLIAHVQAAVNPSQE